MEKLPMELLIFLLRHRGELVSRDEIASHLWGKDVFLDVDHSINTAIRKIRRALHDDSEKPRFIETVVGKGYRFAAPVTVGDGESISNPTGDAELEPRDGTGSAGGAQTATEFPVATQSRAFPRVTVLLAGLAILALAVMGFVISYPRKNESISATGIHSLAVLPLKNVSGDPQQEYFADGITDALIDRFSHISGLRVISRNSAMRLRNTRLSVPEVARALNVDGVVEGSVAHQGSRVLVTLQLLRGATGQQVWAEDYDRELRTVPGLQDEVARTIAERIMVGLSPQQRIALAATKTVDPEAEENYLKGEYYLDQRTIDSLRKSVGFFEQAIARDPNYANPYSGLADAYALLGFRGADPATDALARAKAAAEKALALDGMLAGPHASLAFIAETHEWDWAKAEREYKRALELNPGDAEIHHLYAGYLMYVGRYEEGLAEARLARDLDPLSLPVNNALAGRLLVAGHNREALEQVRKTLELNPYYAPAHQTLGWAYLRTGKTADALREFQEAVHLSGSDDFDLMLDLGFAYATAGKLEDARKVLAEFKQLNREGRVPAGSVAILYGALGERDQAFVWLNKAYAEHDPQLTYLKVPGRRFEPLRHDPRFGQMVRRVGLPQ
jgi:TolB-like protein/DNA-binding winged helix-turn-helix (wHTH) protein/Flp pilus assembly protein TadD